MSALTSRVAVECRLLHNIPQPGLAPVVAGYALRALFDCSALIIQENPCGHDQQGAGNIYVHRRNRHLHRTGMALRASGCEAGVQRKLSGHVFSADRIWQRAGIRAVIYPALGLAAEAGEVANKVKKILRDGDFDRKAVADEIGDCLWYIAALCRDLNVNMNDVARANLSKLQDRKKRGVISGSGDNR